jgi:hypothetical protein
VNTLNDLIETCVLRHLVIRYTELWTHYEFNSYNNSLLKQAVDELVQAGRIKRIKIYVPCTEVELLLHPEGKILEH